MWGTIIGDIVGSRFEFDNHKSKNFDLLDKDYSFFTDDTVMTAAVAEALIMAKKKKGDLGAYAAKCLRRWGNKYPFMDYGISFEKWLFNRNAAAYNSWGNGAAMRVSPCGLAAGSLEEAMILSRRVTEITHNHPEGLKGAEAVAVAVYLAKVGKNKEQIRNYVAQNYYEINFRLDDIRESYGFDESCQGSVPQALAAFFEAKDFDDSIRNAISVGGDSDTIAAIAGGVAEAYYGVPETIRNEVVGYLDQDLLEVIKKFYECFAT